MARKKLTKQEKKKAEAEQAEALRIEMEKERLLNCIFFMNAPLNGAYDDIVLYYMSNSNLRRHQ